MGILRELIDKSSEPAFVLDAAGLLIHANSLAISLLRSYNLEPGKPIGIPIEPHNPTVITIVGDKDAPLTLALCPFDTSFDGKSIKIVLIKEMKMLLCKLLPMQTSPEIRQKVLQNGEDIKAIQYQFCAEASHELRTPLTTIRESIALIHDEIIGSLSDKQKQTLAIAIRNCDRMKALITKMLDMARITVGMYELNRVEVNLMELITRCFDEWLPRCQLANRQLLVELPEELPAVRCDPDSILTVLNNLIDNACKYTMENGVIKLKARKISDAFVAVSVEDNGIGIPQMYHEAIFDPFVQVKEENAPMSTFGVGLGLNIVQNLVRLNRGIITLTSAHGKGSCFTFTLPIFRATRLYKILIVDDNIENLKWMEYSLKMVNENLEVRTTSSGLDALLLVGKILPDLIILDVHLPGIDGHNIVSSIKKQQKAISNIPKILLISADPEAIEHTDAEKSEASLIKPFSTEQLVLTVEKLLGIGGHDDGYKSDNTGG